MKKSLAIFLLIAALPCFATKQLTTSVAFQDLQGNPLANGFILFQLNTSARIIAGGQLVSNTEVVKINLGPDGKVVAGQSIFANDELLPTGTYYSVQVNPAPGSGQSARGPEFWILSGTSPIDLSLITAVDPITIDPAYSKPVLQNPAASQTITGQSLTLTGSVPFSAQGTNTLKNLNGIQYCDQFPGATADVQIAAAIAALPASGGTIDCRGYGASTQTIAAPLVIGTAGSKFVTILMDRVTFFQCTITSGGVCWTLNPGSGMVAFGPVNSPTTTGGLGVSNAASVSSVIKSIASSGTNRPILDNIVIPGNASATISDSVVNLQDVLDGTSINNLSIGGFLNTYLLKIVTSSAASSGPTNINNVTLNCLGLTGCKPLLVDSVANNAVLGGINFFGGSISHPGSGGLALATLQDTGAAGQNQGVNFFGTQFESINAADIGVYCNGCRGLTMVGTIFTASSSVGTDCIRIAGNAAGIDLENVNNFNGWTNTLNNQVNSTVLTSSTTILSHYTYMRFTTTSNALWEDNNGTIFGIDSTNSVRSGRAIVNSETTAPSGQANKDVCYGDSTAHAVKCSYNNGTFLALPQVIGSGTAAMTTGLINAGACGSTVTVAASGVATTDAISFSFNAAPAANPAELVISSWPTANNVNFQYCNPTAGGVTPSAATLNWRVVR